VIRAQTATMLSRLDKHLPGHYQLRATAGRRHQLPGDDCPELLPGFTVAVTVSASIFLHKREASRHTRL
jgi:hypothetical protein